MKRLAIFMIILMISAIFVLINVGGDEVLRLHVKANSDDEIDMNIKLEVASYINELIGDKIKCVSCNEAEKWLSDRLPFLRAAVNEKLKSLGADYEATLELKKSDFPSRSYGNTFFPSGEYSALVISLGSGEGDNWWCVLYPRLCYGKGTGGNEVIYRSRIVEAYKKLFKER